MSTVHVRNVKKSYSDLTVIEDLSFDIHDGEFMVFVGPLRLRQVHPPAHDRRARILSGRRGWPSARAS